MSRNEISVWPPLVYLIGSLRNPEVPEIGQAIRAAGFDVFDDWFAAGPLADDAWRDYEVARQHGYVEALRGRAAKHVFHFDYKYLLRAAAGVLVLPAGRSGHLELGFLMGRGKPGYILLDKSARWEVMYKFADAVCETVEDIIDNLHREFVRQSAAAETGAGSVTGIGAYGQQYLD